ncbi:MAG TPA: hypothetical protein VIF40_16175 [Methylosinus sp.]|jgi:hypothetical protein|uniref:hypothetical protein n=1 Tax=Methylosinus sp. TaxID=427 RepID=UPI002F94813F
MNSAAITIVRGAHRSCFTTIKNELLQNKIGLSCQSRAILFDLLSRPENWHVVIEHLAKVHMIGRDQVYKALAELRDKGFATLEKLRDGQTGKIKGSRWIITEEPATTSPRPENQDAAETASLSAVSGISGHGKVENKDNIQNPPKAPDGGREGDFSQSQGDNSAGSSLSDAWQTFSANWPWRIGEQRHKAQASFSRLNADEQADAIRGVPAFRAAIASRTHPPHAATYLTERMWQGVPPATSQPQTSKASSAPGRPAMAILRPDGQWFLKEGSPQLARWKEYERQIGKKNRSLFRPTEWPPNAQTSGVRGAASEQATACNPSKMVPMPQIRAGIAIG